MIAYWDRGLEWMGEGLQLAICPSFTGPTSLAALDVSGNANHGTLTNMDRNTAWVTSGGRSALSFDGTNYVDCGSRVPFFPTTHTMSFWLFDRNSGLRFFSYYDNGPTFYRNINRWAIVNSGGFAWVPSPFLFINSFVWQHVAYTRQGNDVAFFVNGVLERTSTITTTFTATNTVRLGAGTAFGGEPSNFIGDDFRISSRALTASEIRQMYDFGRGGGMLYQPPKRRSVFIAAGFRAYWHRRQSQLIGGGV